MKECRCPVSTIDRSRGGTPVIQSGRLRGRRDEGLLTLPVEYRGEMKKGAADSRRVSGTSYRLLGLLSYDLAGAQQPPAQHSLREMGEVEGDYFRLCLEISSIIPVSVIGSRRPCPAVIKPPCSPFRSISPSFLRAERAFRIKNNPFKMGTVVTLFFLTKSFCYYISTIRPLVQAILSTSIPEEVFI